VVFKLHSKLENDTFIVGEFELCLLLLHCESRYPWCILVPKRAGIEEIFQLNQEERSLLMEESTQVSEVMARTFKADKMNVATLGNIVPQLHIHHIARFTKDAAWPDPVWGKFVPQPYQNQERERRLALLRRDFQSRATLRFQVPDPKT